MRMRIVVIPCKLSALFTVTRQLEVCQGREIRENVNSVNSVDMMDQLSGIHYDSAMRGAKCAKGASLCTLR